MARPKDSFNKREKEKQRQKEKQEKKAKMEERKASQIKGKSLNDMMAYIDEDGNISSTPPDPAKKRVFNAEDIEIGVSRPAEEEADDVHEGRVDYFNQSKGFGFIISKTGERVFFHVNQLTEPVAENDKVVFDLEKGPKGWNAVGVRKHP